MTFGTLHTGHFCKSSSRPNAILDSEKAAGSSDRMHPANDARARISDIVYQNHVECEMKLHLHVQSSSKLNTLCNLN
jgi:hypothetical protein